MDWDADGYGACSFIHSFIHSFPRSSSLVCSFAGLILFDRVRVIGDSTHRQPATMQFPSAPLTILFLVSSLAMASALPATATATALAEQAVVATPIAMSSAAPVVEAATDVSSTGTQQLIPGMSGSGATILFVMIGCVLILVPVFGYIWVRRSGRILRGTSGADGEKGTPRLEKSESKVSLVGTILSRRDTAGSTDTWMDEVRMPTKVLTLKKGPGEEGGCSVIRTVDV
jgi:hypothetical protein